LCGIFYFLFYCSVYLIQIESLVLIKCKFNQDEYFGSFNIIMFIDICTLQFYDINMDVVSLFADSSFFVYNDLEFVTYHCSLSIWMNVVYFCKKINKNRKEKEGSNNTSYIHISTLSYMSIFTWVPPNLYMLFLNFQILLSTEVVPRLSHDQVALFRTSAQNCARKTINHVASRIKQVQLQLFD